MNETAPRGRQIEKKKRKFETEVKAEIVTQFEGATHKNIVIELASHDKSSKDWLTERTKHKMHVQGETRHLFISYHFDSVLIASATQISFNLFSSIYSVSQRRILCLEFCFCSRLSFVFSFGSFLLNYIFLPSLYIKKSKLCGTKWFGSLNNKYKKQKI